MNEIHILMTGVGRRVELIQAFRNAALKLNIALKLYGADMVDTAPALVYCDYTRKVCAMRDPQYIQKLVDICIADSIDLVMPTIDTDLLVLSQNVSAFEKVGVKVLVSKPDKILICRDKNNTGEFFESCGLKAPKTYNNYKNYPDSFPCFIKPKDGSSSIGAFKVEDKEELIVYARQVEDYIIQSFVTGKEFTIDIFCDFDGNPIYITPRERVQIRAGEVLKTRIYMDEIMVEEAKKLCEVFKPCGPITIQLIQDKNTGDNYYIEINPRYGGGAPLSMKSGARSAEALLRLISGEKLIYQENHICNGDIYSRFDQSVCIYEGDNIHPIKGVIFDLDDTLYSEKNYVKSGYKRIEEYLGRLDAADKLWEYFLNGRPAIDEYLTEIGECEKKAECLMLYREQLPQIELYDGVIDLIMKLKARNIKVGIITDGRPEGQKNKLKVLGLDKIIDDIIITDELGGVQFRKPCDIAFRIMQIRWRLPYEDIVYVGDNPKKDFQACKQLGMGCIYFKNMDGLYSEEINDNCHQVCSIKELTEYCLQKGKDNS